ncbi:MAG: Ig-like domain-containing protein, partial [Thermoguttaceae bacterium]
MAGGIDGVKWLDVNADGLRDANETGIHEWTIYLDQNQNGHRDDGELVTRTDEHGEYHFPELPDGVYTVAEEMRDGWVQTFPGPQAALKEIETYPLSEATAIDFRFTSAAVVDYANTDPTLPGNRLAVDVSVEVVWPDWSWSVQPERTHVTVEGSTIEIGVVARNSEVYPLPPSPKIETHSVSLPPLEPGRYSMTATLYEDDIRFLHPAPIASRGTSAVMVSSAIGTHTVEVPGDPTSTLGEFAPRHFDFGNVRREYVRGPHVVSHSPSGEIPHPVHEVLVTFSEPINPETFTPEDVNVTIGFLRVAVPVFDVSPVEHNTFRIKFGGPDVAMDYHVRLGPHIENLAGMEMDQDRDGRPGESVDDVYDASFVVVAEPTAPRVVHQWPAPNTTEGLVSSVSVRLNEPMDASTINENTFWVAGNVDGNALGTDGVVEMQVPGKVSYDEATSTVTFTPDLERLPVGTYVVVAEDAITDADGVALDGEWLVRFPSGNGEPGGHYLTLFEVSGHTTSSILGSKFNDANGNV